MKLTDMEDKLKKYLDFCKKYPDTIVGYEHGINVSHYLMEGKKTPQVDYFKVCNLIKMYNENPNVFSEYKNLKEDWNDLIATKLVDFIKPQMMSYEIHNSEKYELPVVFFLGIKVIRYRIVRDGYAGFECQKWRLWFPFWLQMGYANTHPSIDVAISYIENDGTVVLSS
jgi:hypothetical protein